MIGMPIESYTQNGEDIVLWRALGLTEPGRYVDVSNDERFLDSPTFLFYTQGWRGLVCASSDEGALRDKSRRPEDEVFETESSGIEVGSLLASSNRAGQVHLLVLALGPRVGAVVQAFDWERWRPWVVAVESVGRADHQAHHDAWEADLLGARYALCLFDGVVRYYVAEEHAGRLGPQLAYPAGPRDTYTTPLERELRGAYRGSRGKERGPRLQPGCLHCRCLQMESPGAGSLEHELRGVGRPSGDARARKQRLPQDRVVAGHPATPCPAEHVPR